MQTYISRYKKLHNYTADTQYTIHIHTRYTYYTADEYGRVFLLPGSILIILLQMITLLIKMKYYPSVVTVLHMITMLIDMDDCTTYPFFNYFITQS